MPSLPWVRVYCVAVRRATAPITYAPLRFGVAGSAASLRHLPSCPQYINPLSYKSSIHPQLEMHPFWQTRFQNFDSLRSTHYNPFRHRMMFYCGPSRIVWFAFGAFAATFYHRTQQARGEYPGWGPGWGPPWGPRRVEEWRAERAAGTDVRERCPLKAASQERKNETTRDWSWRPTAPPLSEDDAVRRRWEEKSKDAQETVRIPSNYRLHGVLTENFGNSGCRPV